MYSVSWLVIAIVATRRTYHYYPLALCVVQPASLLGPKTTLVYWYVPHVRKPYSSGQRNEIKKIVMLVLALRLMQIISVFYSSPHFSHSIWPMMYAVRYFHLESYINARRVFIRCDFCFFLFFFFLLLFYHILFVLSLPDSTFILISESPHSRFGITE